MLLPKRKQCTKCGRKLPATTDFFRKAKGYKYGLRGECKECEKKYKKQWDKNNPHINFNSHIKEKHGLDSNITKEQYYEILEYFGYKCAYCGCDLDSDNTTLDHIIPLSKGGATDPWCLVPCCKSCNSSKNNKNYLLWLNEKEMFDKFEMLSRYIDLMFDKYNDN